MKSEDTDYTFRKQLESLATPPPQTRWKASRSWQQIERNLHPEPVKKSGLGWYPAVAAAVWCIVSAFLFYYYTQQQAQISQLTAELQQAKAIQTQQIVSKVSEKESTTLADFPAETVALPTNVVVLPPDKQVATLMPTKIRKADHPDTTSVLYTPAFLKGEQISQEPVSNPDSLWKGSPLSPVQLLGAKLKRQPKSHRRERTVILVFPGEATAISEPASPEAVPTEKNGRWMRLGNQREATLTNEEPATSPSSGLLLKIK